MNIPLVRAFIQKIVFPNNASGSGKTSDFYIFEIDSQTDDSLRSYIQENEKKHHFATNSSKIKIVAKGHYGNALGSKMMVELIGCSISFDYKFKAYTVLFESLREYTSLLAIFKGTGKLDGKTIHDIERICSENRISVKELVENKKLFEKSFTTKTSQKILAIYQSHIAKNDTLQYLSFLGLPESVINPVYSLHGEDAKTIAHNNIYRFLDFGVDFQIVDSIFLSKFEGRKTDSRRLTAGVLHCLDTIKHLTGDLFMAKEDLLSFVASELDVHDESLITSTFSTLLLLGSVVCRKIDGIECLYSSENYSLDFGTAELLRPFIFPKGFKTRFTSAFIDKAILEYEQINSQRLPDGLSAEQKYAVQESLLHKIAIITGGPGTGKTTIQDCLVFILQKFYSANDKKQSREQILTEKLAVFAPTGIAARKISEVICYPASTIHRGLGYNPFGGFLKNATCRFSEEFIIVDESSMLSVDILVHLLQAIDPEKTQIIFIGDNDQLPSIGPGKFFEDLISCNQVHVSILSKIYRQKTGSSIITNAYKIKTHDINLSFDDGTEFIEITTGEGLEEKYNNMNASDHEEKFILGRQIDEIYSKQYKDTLIRLHKEYGLTKNNSIVLSPVKEGFAGTKRTNLLLQEALNQNANAILKNTELFEEDTLSGKTFYSVKNDNYEFFDGDKVIQTENNYEKDVVNGSIGIVETANTERSAKRDKKYLELCFDGSRITTFTTEKDIKQLELGFSVTVHKSQGLEYEYVIIPVFHYFKTMLNWKLYYTALTRAKKKCIFIGKRNVLNFLIQHSQIRSKKTNLSLAIQELGNNK